ncbi:TPA: 30S ribosomal protein S8e [Candidatus Woesearchaeota archaeon]|nr:30S ribosomal protein S8e [Candidatus Woesearchaeota archaeon]
MARSQFRPKRKESGGRYIAARKKKLYELGREPTNTKLEEASRKRTIRVMGAHQKVILLAAEAANVYDPEAKAYRKAKIKTIAENPANSNYVRRNIITKGAVLDTEMGKVRVTSRPGQDGVVNAVVIVSE